MHKRGLCCCAVSVRPSDVCHVRCVEMSNNNNNNNNNKLIIIIIIIILRLVWITDGEKSLRICDDLWHKKNNNIHISIPP